MCTALAGVFLDQGSYIYHHSSVLKHVISVARAGLSKSDSNGNLSIFHDIPGETGDLDYKINKSQSVLKM